MESEAPSKPAEEDFNGVSRVWFGIPIFPYLKKMQSQNVPVCFLHNSTDKNLGGVVSLVGNEETFPHLNLL